MSLPVALAFTLLAGVPATRAAAQATDNAAKAAALKDSVGANQARLRKFQWIQTTKMSVGGELKQTAVASCGYQGSAPKATCTEISSTPTEQPSGGPLRKKKMEEAIAGMKAFMDSVKTLIGQYVPPPQAKIEAAMKAGNVAVAPNPSTGAVSLAISNYTQQGDKMTITVGAANYELRAVAISTWQGDPSHPVTLAVTYANLNSGNDYAASTLLNATGDRKITVAVTTANYTIAP